MNCLICKSKTYYFLTKDFNCGPYKFLKNINSINYFKCSKCGFTFSKTHVDMRSEQWEQLNYDFHHFHENHSSPTNQPPYLNQAVMLYMLYKNQIIDFKSIIDYAGGYGTLSKILKKYFTLNLPVYDPYIKNELEIQYIKKEDLKKYNVVITSALFEHLFKRKSFDDINNLVEDNGFLIIHTVVCENIPKDENWFYMEPPVHCAFHTNKSMEILMKQWNYQASIYCPDAKSWILIKNHNQTILDQITKINKEYQKDYFIYKEGFVDYWKGF